MVDVLRINGVDFAPYVAEGGLKYSRNDLDSEDSGRTTMDGVMHRCRIAVKSKFEVSCIPVNDETIQRLLNAIFPEFVSVTLHHPLYGLVTQTYYSNNVSCSLKRVERDGAFLWEGLTFPLIER